MPKNNSPSYSEFLLPTVASANGMNGRKKCLQYRNPAGSNCRNSGPGVVFLSRSSRGVSRPPGSRNLPNWSSFLVPRI